MKNLSIGGIAFQSTLVQIGSGSKKNLVVLLRQQKYNQEMRWHGDSRGCFSQFYDEIICKMGRINKTQQSKNENLWTSRAG